MASSNRHWPSMFKSKPCNNHQHHHQWQHQHDLNSSFISSANCQRSPYSSSVVGCEERSPEPKPRWNPKPEQIRILEAIFNSGMVNPPRDEIRRIRGQLQEYGQVGDANVFYWFQNRKSRSKHKQRNQFNSSKISHPNTTSPAIPAPTHSSPENVAVAVAVAAAAVSSPDPSVLYEPLMAPFEPFLFPVSTGSGTDVTCRQGFGFSNEMNVNGGLDPRGVISCSGILMNQDDHERQMNDIIMGNEKKRVNGNGNDDDDEKMKLQNHQQQVMSYNNSSFSATHLVASTASSSVVTAAVTASSSFNHILGIEEHQSVAPPPIVGRYTVFINDVAFEVSMAPLNVREAFGHDAVLFHSSGQPVLTDEWGVTLQPLQHGCLYYLLRALLS